MLSLLNKFLKPLGYSVHNNAFHKSRYLHRYEFQPLRQLFYQHLHPNFFFVQIGANDGVSYDPIYELVTTERVKGIALEPIPDIFEKLQLNYAAHPQVTLVNKAIHATEKTMTMYRVDPVRADVPEWTKGTPSFNKAHHQLSGITDDMLVQQQVACISWQQLLDDYAIGNIDLLQIDTEGYDLEIIHMIDFSKTKPRIISFEHGLHDGVHSLADFQQVQGLLLEQRYQILIQEYDAIAYL